MKSIKKIYETFWILFEVVGLAIVYGGIYGGGMYITLHFVQKYW